MSIDGQTKGCWIFKLTDRWMDRQADGLIDKQIDEWMVGKPCLRDWYVQPKKLFSIQHFPL